MITRINGRDLAHVDEAFMTNVVVGVVPVGTLARGRERIRLTQWLTADALRRLLELS
jgi:branched-subunit amino acid aminotransferase/4-amino-4-deoxychorismate lyase